MMSYIIIRKENARNKTGLPNSSFYAQIVEGLIPPPIRLGKRAVGWVESEIDAVVLARIQGKSDEEIKILVAELVTARTAQH